MKGNRAGDAAAAAAAAKQHNVSFQGTARSDSSGRLAALVGDVMAGTDRPALDRVRRAAVHARELIDNGAQRTTVITSLTVAAEAAGVPRRVAEEVLLRTLRGDR